MQIRNNEERGRWVLMVFGAMAVMYCVVIVSDLMQYNLLQQEFFSVEEGEANDTRQMILGIVQIIMIIIGGTFFIMWFRRAYFNLHALKVPLQFTEGWASGAWFVPILNLFRPYQIMDEIWEKTQIQINVSVQEPKTLIGVWWGLWVIQTVLERISSRMILNASTIESLKESTIATLVGNVISLASLILVIIIVRKIREWEEVLYRQSNEMSIEDHLI